MLGVLLEVVTHRWRPEAEGEVQRERKGKRGEESGEYFPMSTDDEMFPYGRASK